MNILVVGATGVLGRHVVPRLLENGYRVRALIRYPEQEKFLSQMGVEPIMGDIFDLNSLNAASYGCSAVLHLATAIPKSAEQDWSMNDRIRREGTRNLLNATLKNGVKRYVQQSIALVYGDKGQEIVDETASLQDSSISQSSIDMEEMVRATKLEWSILRGGIFYGAGTGREDGWRKLAKDGKLLLPGDGNDLISLVHVVDYARAVVTAIENDSSGSIYNIVENEPVSYKRLFTHITAQLGVDAPKAGGSKFLPSLGCRNDKARKELGWFPLYPSFLSGLVM